MKKNLHLILGISAILILVCSGLALSQEAIEKGGAVPEVQSQNEPEMQWVWGEVANIDSQNKAITVKYLDYETDQEKELLLNIDDKTTFENVKTFDEIKVKDAVSVDYMAGQGAKFIAKNISVESPETTKVEGAAAEKPEGMKPAAEDTSSGAAAAQDNQSLPAPSGAEESSTTAAPSN